MRMSQPVGDPVWGALFIRLPLGAYFILAGMAKLDVIPWFIKEVEKFKVLNGHSATLYGILLPYAEICAGALLVLGLWTTLASILCSLMLLSYIIGLGLFPYTDELTKTLFNKDVVLLGASVSLMYIGAGAYSVDRFRTSA